MRGGVLPFISFLHAKPFFCPHETRVSPNAVAPEAVSFLDEDLLEDSNVFTGDLNC